jgi:hypothetical protein
MGRLTIRIVRSRVERYEKVVPDDFLVDDTMSVEELFAEGNDQPELIESGPDGPGPWIFHEVKVENDLPVDG